MNTQLLTPPGRIVNGDLYKPNTTDAEGKPLVYKSGPNIGQPREEFYFAIAIPKGPEQHWAQTQWGALIYAVGQTSSPQAHQAPTFAWKVKDGDSQIPNRKNKKPCDQEGYRGHWVLSFSSGYPPKTYRNNGTEQITEKDAIKPGYWVQVFGSVADNGSPSQPGVFLNHSMVNFIGYDKEIISGPDAASVGFGQGVTLPPGVSATPPAGSFNPAAPMTAPAPLPGYVAPPPAAYTPPPVPMAAAPVYVAPNPGFLAPPPVPGAPAAPPAAPVRRMTAKAAGAPYESFIAQNWNDQMLIQHGYMEA